MLPSDRPGLAASTSPAVPVPAGIRERSAAQLVGPLDRGGCRPPTDGPEIGGDGGNRLSGREQVFRVGIGGGGQVRVRVPLDPGGESPERVAPKSARRRGEAAHVGRDGSGAAGGFVGPPKRERGGGADGGGFGVGGCDRDGGGVAHWWLRFGGVNVYTIEYMRLDGGGPSWRLGAGSGSGARRAAGLWLPLENGNLWRAVAVREIPPADYRPEYLDRQVIFDVESPAGAAHGPVIDRLELAPSIFVDLERNGASVVSAI